MIPFRQRVLIGLMLCHMSLWAQASTVFSGRPVTKISEGGVERVAEDLPREKAVNLACVISRIGEKYYWASRENKSLVRIESGAYITFIAVDGSGYIRLIEPTLKSAASLSGETESKFDYVEHLLLGLKSVTYYGKRH